MADLPAKVKALGIQLDRRKPMAEARKLQKDIEITIKKIADGISDLLVCKNKAMAAIAAEVIASSMLEWNFRELEATAGTQINITDASR